MQGGISDKETSQIQFSDGDKKFCQDLALSSCEHLDGEAKLCQRCTQLLDEPMIGKVRTIFGEQAHHEPEQIYTAEDTSEPTSQIRRDLESMLSRLFQV